MRFLIAVVVCLLIAVPAGADLLELYSFDDVQYGAGASKARSQMFSPTESTPDNGLIAGDLFDQVGMKLDVSDGESITFDLKLFAWNTDYGTTIAGTPIAQSLGVSISNAFYDYITVDCAPQDAGGVYLIQCYISAFSGENWGFARSSSGDGGTNNEAFNDSGMKTDREYQVQLQTVVVPEPSSMAIFGLGLIGLVRRRK